MSINSLHSNKGYQLADANFKVTLNLHHDNRSIDEYIHISKMDESSTWATQVEMFALTHLLGICLYVYSEHFGRF